MVLKDKVAIVTGGAGGIGRGVTRALCKDGAKVLITDINEESLNETKSELKELGYDIETIVCDGGDMEQVKKAVQKTVDAYGKLDIVINNAHASKQKPFEQLTVEDMNLSLNTGMWATYNFMQQAFPHLKETKGCIVNFGSAAAIKGQQYQASYAAAKEAIRGMTRVVAREWGAYGIRVNIVCPFAMTPGVEKWKAAFPEEYKKSIDAVPLKRIGDPESDIGRTIVFLCSEDASYITGLTVEVDGGGDMRP